MMPVLAFFFFFQILLMWTIFKVFIEFVTILYLSFCFVFCFVAMRHVVSLLPD